MQQYYTFNQLVEQLPEICKEQRRFLQLTQADVIERLEKETGIKKDQSKISMFESGKIAIPDFLSDYCAILDIRFPEPSYRKEYLMEEKNVTRGLVAKEMNIEKVAFIKKVVKETMCDMGYEYELDDNKDIQLDYIDEYYCVKATIPIVYRDDIIYLADNYIFAFKTENNMPKLCGRTEVYSILPIAFMNESIESEIMLYFEEKSSDFDKLSQNIQRMIKELMKNFRKQNLKKFHNNFELISKELSSKLLKHNSFIIGDVYVYKIDRKQECFISMMEYIDHWLGFGEDTTWTCNTNPIYLKEKSGQCKEVIINAKDTNTLVLMRNNAHIYRKIGCIKMQVFHGDRYGGIFCVHKGNL